MKMYRIFSAFKSRKEVQNLMQMYKRVMPK
jgi:hypothetical protein